MPLRTATGGRRRFLRWALPVLCLAWTPAGGIGQEPEAASMFRLERQIGLAGTAEAQFTRVTDLAVAPDGRVYVLDGPARLVRVYDAAGEFVHAFGGGGPEQGELEAPTALRIFRDTVLVFDPARQRVAKYSPDGQLLGSAAVVAPANLMIADPVPLRDGRMLARSVYRASAERRERDPLIHLVAFRPDVPRVDTLTRVAASPVVWYVPARPAQWGGEPSPFGQGGAWALAGDSLLALVDGYAGTVKFLRVETDGLRAAGTVALSARGRPVMERDLGQLRREIDAQRTIPLPRDAAFLTPAQWSVVTGQAFFARDGSLWMERNNLSETRVVWSRVDPQTGTVRNFAFPLQFALRSVDGTLCIGVWTEDDGRQTVRAYRATGILRS